MRTVWGHCKQLTTLIAIHDYASKRLQRSRNELNNERMIQFWKSVKMRLACFDDRFYREYVTRGYPMNVVNY